MKILIDHTTDHTNFLLHSLWSLSWFMMVLQQKKSLIETDLPEFYIYDSNPDPNLSSAINQTVPDLPFKLINEPERRSIFQEMEESMMHLESTMILPRVVYYSTFDLPEDMKNKNICVPLMTYKYNYKTVTFQGKEFRIKNFIRSEETFFENSFIPDWDERLYMTHALLAKLGDDPPLMSPSPLLHEWGHKARLIKNNNHQGEFDQDKDIVIGKMSHAVHKFERVADDSI